MTIEQRPSLSIALPKSYLFTSESVTEGHPDKMCDQISDAILDAIISKEIELEREGYIAPSGQPADVSRMRCACETLATTGLVAVAGEIRTQAYVDVPAIVREVVCGIGYDRAKYGFDGTTCGVVNAIHEQSPDIAQKYGVMSVPTLIVFENGQVKKQAVGVQPKQNILSMIG